jgi:hypothetical protein
MKRLLIVLWVLIAVSASAQAPSFWLRNTDTEGVFYWWAVPVTVGPVETVLPRLPLAPGGRHAAAPGERVRVTLDVGQNLVGVFVPWGGNLSFRTVVYGGFLLASEVPAKGTLLVNASSFAAANRGRALEAPLQAWGLSVPQFVLDGKTEDWVKVLPALEWGPQFRPDARAWPAVPRPRSLQVADGDGALWIRLTSDQPWPAGASLVLSRPGAFLEWPLSGGIVWSWTGTDASPAGWGIANGTEFEAWIPWDRLPPVDHAAWKDAHGTWSLAVTVAGAVQRWDLGAFVLGELP